MRMIRINTNKICIISIISTISILVSYVAFAQQSELDLLQEQIKLKEAEIARLEIEAEKFRENISQTQGQKKTLQNQLKTIENRISSLQSDLKVTKVKIAKTELNVKSLANQINKKQSEIGERKAGIGKSLRAMAYLDNENIVLSLLRSDRLSDFLSEARYFSNLQDSLYNDFRLLAQARKNLEDFKIGEEDKKIELVDLRKSLTAQNTLVENQKKEKNQLLIETKNQEKNYQKQLLEVQKKQAEIQQEIFGLEDKLRGKISGLPMARAGVLAWPLAGIVTQTYGPTNETGFYNLAYKFHNGIDIAASLGAPVRAALEGDVLASGDNGKYAYGQWIAIKHQNGLITLYAHLSAKAAIVGQYVDEGQIIGYEGASGFVTGPHLHFTVYSANTFKVEQRWFGLLPLGGSVNPLDYL